MCLFSNASQLERGAREHVCNSFQAPARSGFAKVLTLCVQGLARAGRGGGNPAHRSRGPEGAVLLSLVRKRSRSLLHHQESHRPVYTPGRSSRQAESWLGLRGAAPRPRGLCGQWVRPGQRACRGTDEGSGTVWLGESGGVSPGPLWASVLPTGKEGAGSTIPAQTFHNGEAVWAFESACLLNQGQPSSSPNSFTHLFTEYQSRVRRCPRHRKGGGCGEQAMPRHCPLPTWGGRQ